MLVLSSVATAFIVAPVKLPAASAVRGSYRTANAEMVVSAKSTLAELRSFVAEKGLVIKTSGPGRTKAVIWTEIKEHLSGEVVPTAVSPPAAPAPAPAPPPPAPPATPAPSPPPPPSLSDEDIDAIEASTTLADGDSFFDSKDDAEPEPEPEQ